MIVLSQLNTILIHIPRTAGVAIAHAVARAGISHAWLNSFEWMHANAYMGRTLLGDPRVVAVMRSPWDIYRSHYGWLKRMARRLNSVHPQWLREAIASEAAMPFPDMVRYCIDHDILDYDGGFLDRYVDDQTNVYRYEQTPWGQLLGFRLPIYCENRTVDPLPPWDGGSVDLITHRCRNDIARMGYQPPEGVY